MDGLLEPIGPEPARTYWIRRIIVVLAALVVIAVLWSLIARLVTPPEKKPAVAPTTAKQTAAVAPKTTAAVAPATSASSSAAADAATSAADTPAASAAPDSPTPTGPVACDPAKVTLAVSGNANVKSGDTTNLKFALTNNSGVDCILDMNPKSTIVRITSGDDRIWSTEDCDQWLGQPKKDTVGAGKTLEWAFDWNTKRSAAGCKLTDDYLKPGTYVVRASYEAAVNGAMVLYLHG